MNPSVSVMVPVFNRAGLLATCLDSVLAQTWRDLEVVLVDGASTDDTWTVCLKYAAMDSRVHAIREEVNSGPVRGWRRCLDEARGTLATFLWSDDEMHSEFLSATVPVLADPMVGFVFVAAEIGSMPGQGAVCYAHPTGTIASEDFVWRSLRNPGEFPISPACALFRLADLRSNLVMELPTDPPADLTTTGAGSDLLLYLRTALAYPRIAAESRALAFFRVHGGSLTVEGRGGRVNLDYALTKSWFARSRGDIPLSHAILGRHWIGQIRSRRRLSSPFAAARQYHGLITPQRLVAAAALELARYRG